MSVVSERTGHRVGVSVVERFPLVLSGTSKVPRSRRASTAQPSYREATPSIINNRQVAHPVIGTVVEDKQLRELKKFKDWAEGAIRAQQNDLDRISGVVNRMEKDMDSFKTFMDDVRTELATYRQFQESLKDDELRSIKQDMNSIRQELNANRQFKNSLTEEEFPVLQEDMDALRSDLADTKHAQQELKVRDIKYLQQDLAKLRHSMESLSNIVGNDPKVSNEKFESLVDEVRVVNEKASDIFNFKDELGQLKARLLSMETSTRAGAAAQGVDKPMLENTPHQETEIPHYERCGPRKKQTHFLDSRETEHNLPIKRRKRSPGQITSILSSGNASTKPSAVQFHTENLQGAPSSNHGTPSPTLDRSIVQTVSNTGETKDSSNKPITFSNLQDLRSHPRRGRKSQIEESTASAIIQAPSTLHNPVASDVIESSARKTRAARFLTAQELTQAGMNSVHKSGDKLHKAMRALLNKESRSSWHVRERSDTPDQLSTLSADEAMQKSARKRSSVVTKGSARNIFPSVAPGPVIGDIDKHTY